MPRWIFKPHETHPCQDSFVLWGVEFQRGVPTEAPDEMTAKLGAMGAFVRADDVVPVVTDVQSDPEPAQRVLVPVQRKGHRRR